MLMTDPDEKILPADPDGAKSSKWLKAKSRATTQKAEALGGSCEPGWNKGRLEASDIKEIQNRNTKITQLVDSLVSDLTESRGHRRCYRMWFFAISMFVFVAVLVISAIAIIGSNDEIAVVIGGFATILSTVIALPLLIGKNLFPEKDDDKAIELIKEASSGDMTLRSYHSDSSPQCEKPLVSIKDISK